MKTLLILGVIALFIGLAFIPSFNAVSISKTDDTTPPVTTHSLDPPTPDGDNGWYVSDVNVTLNATDDMSGVKTIFYRIGDGPVRKIQGDNGSFLIDEDYDNLSIEYWAIDNAENEQTHHTFYIDMDQTKPDIDLTIWIKVKPISFNFMKRNVIKSWTIILNATATDDMSGMERVEFYLSDVLQDTVYGTGPFYTWSFIYYGNISLHFHAIAYDYAGNMELDEIHEPQWINIKQSSIGLDGKNVISIIPTVERENSVDDCDCQSNGKTHLAEKLLNRLEKDEVLSNVINLDTQGDRPICNMLNDTIQRLWKLTDSLGSYILSLPKDSVYRNVLALCVYRIFIFIGFLEGIGIKLHCWDY
jgi:hypothetical protein